jgi:hypothetical protein
VIGAPGESSSATGVDADQYAEAEWWNGAVYQFRRDGLGEWNQAAYIKDLIKRRPYKKTGNL